MPNHVIIDAFELPGAGLTPHTDGLRSGRPRCDAPACPTSSWLLHRPEEVAIASRRRGSRPRPPPWSPLPPLSGVSTAMLPRHPLGRQLIDVAAWGVEGDSRAATKPSARRCGVRAVSRSSRLPLTCHDVLLNYDFSAKHTLCLALDVAAAPSRGPPPRRPTSRLDVSSATTLSHSRGVGSRLLEVLAEERLGQAPLLGLGVVLARAPRPPRRWPHAAAMSLFRWPSSSRCARRPCGCCRTLSCRASEGGASVRRTCRKDAVHRPSADHVAVVLLDDVSFWRVLRRRKLGHRPPASTASRSRLRPWPGEHERRGVHCVAALHAIMSGASSCRPGALPRCPPG